MTVVLTMLGLSLTTKLPIIFGSDGDINVNSQFVNATTHAVLVNMTAQSDSAHHLAQTQKMHHIYGVLAALSSTLFASSVFIFIRKARGIAVSIRYLIFDLFFALSCVIGAHHSVIMFNFGWVAIVETVIITALMDGFSAPKTALEWLLIVLLGFFSFCGQILLTRSLQLEQAGPVSVVRAATDIALAFIWQMWLFGEVPDGWSITGAFLVTTCILITSVRKWVITLPEHSKLKSRLTFIIF